MPIALLARDSAEGLTYAGGALVGLPNEVREKVEGLRRLSQPPVPGVDRRRRATWLEPRLKLRVRHLKGGGSGIRHASVKGLVG